MSKAPLARAAIIGENFIRKIIVQRYLIFNFALRDLRGRYVGSLMGFFWSVIHPLVLLISYTFVFSVVFRIRPPLENVHSYPLFLFCGILPWLYFQDTLLRSCNSVIEHGNLIRKTIFPSEILPISIALSNLVTHVIGLGLLLLLLLFFGDLGWSLLILPVPLVLVFILALGLGWFLAALQVFLRDTAQIVSVLLVLWFWFTPIFYKLEMVPPWLRPWVAVNPLSSAVISYQTILLQDSFPPVKLLAYLGVSASLVAIIGGLVFRNTKREFTDVL
ncbi:MAG: ABC transporter permease [Acidobacteria bacterium]|nr:ABC transporter permease [Acidobacteriota bacterium]